jgi:hypothetical protein
MAKTIHSNNLTFIDLTDSKKVDVHISSNLPTTQIFDGNANAQTYSPDWTNPPLELTLTAYADSTNITTMLTDNDITWYRQVGGGDYSKVQNGGTKLTISQNELGGVAKSAGIISYICSIQYNSKTFENKITFTRVDTGVNGASAPTVQVQYSVDGQTGWTSTLNAATHKYIKYSYDGGKNWTTAIKMVGEDGTSVRIKGTATSKKEVSGTSYWTLVYNSAIITGATLGDAYLLDGDLYVCVDSRDGNDHFMNVGKIQGPKGNDGVSEYVYIRYASKVSPSNSEMTPAPSSTTTHIGICVSTATSAPSTASSYTWSKFVGDSAKNIVLSGDSQVFKGSKTTPITYTPATIRLTANRINIPAATALTWSYNLNNNTGWTTVKPSSVVISGDTATITGASMTTNSLTIKVSDGSVEDVFTVYRAFDGADGSKGDAAPIAFLTNENITFGANAQGSITTTTTFTTHVVAYDGTEPVVPKLRTKADGTIDFPDLPAGMTATHTVSDQKVAITFTIIDRTLGSTSSNNGTITIPVLTPARVDLLLTWSKVNAGAKGEKGNDGTDAYTVMLTNEAHTFAGDINYAYASEVKTQVLGYKGTTEQSITIQSVGGTTVLADNTSYTIADIPGLTFKRSGSEITFTCTTSLKKANGAIPIVVLMDGKSFTRIFSYAIAFKGASGGVGSKGEAGAPATSYWLVSSASAVQKTSTGTITVTPSTLTFTGKSKTGTNAPVDYFCRWIIDYSTNGTSYTNLYTSTANEASKTITVATTYKTIRARMYMAGGTTTLLDEQIIPIVSDGTKGSAGVNAVTFQIYAPNGYLLSNKLESLTLQTFAYEGSTAITSATYAWSYQENDTWVVISNATTSSLTLTKDDVMKSKTYRCAMTYKGTTYYSTATVQDQSDIYDVMICVSDNVNPLTGIYYWVVYALLYSEQGEADALLGPISIDAPTSPVSGDYWYAIDTTTQTVTLKKYNGSAWVTSTDKQAYAYDWRQIVDGTQQQAIGNTDKVQIISCNSFTSSATFQCIVTDTDGSKLARCNIHLTDTSDPIVSATAPVGVKDGQLWMQTQTDGTFLLQIWDAVTSTWKKLNADTKNIVHTSKPSSYKAGDLWVVESDTAISGYTKGTLLQSSATTTTFTAAHWTPSLKYESELAEVQNALKSYKQYMSVDSAGLHMQAKNADGTLSPFQALFTNTRLSFYQDDLEVAYISDNKLNIYEANIDVLSVEKKIQLQKFEWAIESNGSMSLIVNY